MTTREDLRAASQIARADAAVTVATVNRMLEKHEDSKGSTDHHVRAHPGAAESSSGGGDGGWENEEWGQQPKEQPMPPGTGSLAPHNRAYLMERLDSVGLEETLSDWANDEVGGFSDSEGKGLGNIAVEELPEMASKFAEETGTDQEMIQTLLERFHTEDTGGTDGDDYVPTDDEVEPEAHDDSGHRWTERDEIPEVPDLAAERDAKRGPVADPNEPVDAPPGDPYGMDYSDPLRNAVAGATIASTEAVLSLHDTPDSPHFEHSGGGAKDQTRYRRNRKRRDATSERSADWRKRFGSDRSRAGEERRSEDIDLHEDSQGSTDHHKGGKGGKGYRAYRGERGRERGRTSQDDPSQQTGAEAYHGERGRERGGTSDADMTGREAEFVRQGEEWGDTFREERGKQHHPRGEWQRDDLQSPEEFDEAKDRQSEWQRDDDSWGQNKKPGDGRGG